MALRTNNDLITEVLVRNNRTTTDSFVTDTILQGWLKDAHTWATAFRKWPFTEGRISTTYSGTEEITFEGIKADSIRFIKVGSDILQKINFRDYQQMKEDQPGATDKVFTDFGRTTFINAVSGVSGTLTAYAQYQPNLDVTDLTAVTVFSDYDEEGNEAIVEKMTSYLKRREHLPDEAELHDKRASDKLLEVFNRYGGEQFNYQVRNGDGIFKRMDILGGGFREDLFNRDQWN